MDPFLGEIRAFAFDRIPNGWLPCDGRLLLVQSNQALYALLSNRYGGTVNQNFNLPDLRGRTPVCYGPNITMGHKDGSETVALTAAQVPPHTHTVLATSAAASTSSPAGGALATLPTGTNAYAAAPGAAMLNIATVSTSGASASHQNMQPSLAVNWCIATSGLWPSRQ